MEFNGWEIAQAIEHVVLNKTKEIMQADTFFNLSCDEVTSVDCQSWISVHAYVVRDWKQIPLLLTLERVNEGRIANNFTNVIINVVCAHRGHSKKRLKRA